MNVSEVETQFNAAMLGVYESAKRECRYNATRFLQMLTDLGGVETARRLVLSDGPSDGFTALWECGRLDLTVESVVLKEEFAELFSDDVREAAGARLRAYGYEQPSVRQG